MQFQNNVDYFQGAVKGQLFSCTLICLFEVFSQWTLVKKCRLFSGVQSLWMQFVLKYPHYFYADNWGGGGAFVERGTRWLTGTGLYSNYAPVLGKPHWFWSLSGMQTGVCVIGIKWPLNQLSVASVVSDGDSKSIEISAPDGLSYCSTLCIIKRMHLQTYSVNFQLQRTLIHWQTLMSQNLIVLYKFL